MATSKNNKDLRRALEDLVRELPKGKAGLVRWLWPQISEALRKGHSLKVIWGRLQANGLKMKYNEFRVYVWRMKKRTVSPQEEQEKEGVPAPLPAEPSGQRGLARSSLGEAEARTMRHLKKGEGLEWKGTKDADPAKLF